MTTTSGTSSCSCCIQSKSTCFIRCGAMKYRQRWTSSLWRFLRVEREVQSGGEGKRSRSRRRSRSSRRCISPSTLLKDFSVPTVRSPWPGVSINTMSTVSFVEGRGTPFTSVRRTSAVCSAAEAATLPACGRCISRSCACICSCSSRIMPAASYSPAAQSSISRALLSRISTCKRLPSSRSSSYARRSSVSSHSIFSTSSCFASCSRLWLAAPAASRERTASSSSSPKCATRRAHASLSACFSLIRALCTASPVGARELNRSLQSVLFPSPDSPTNMMLKECAGRGAFG
mmetsp:Transcript_28472/g.66635  ORF Transcript_28472/g.66635 Transcript_28472/m.66635 type:complete len:289 (-) Transcript_28472:393-1259(-)